MSAIRTYTWIESKIPRRGGTYTARGSSPPRVLRASWACARRTIPWAARPYRPWDEAPGAASLAPRTAPRPLLSSNPTVGAGGPAQPRLSEQISRPPSRRRSVLATAVANAAPHARRRACCRSSTAAACPAPGMEYRAGYLTAGGSGDGMRKGRTTGGETRGRRRWRWRWWAEGAVTDFFLFVGCGRVGSGIFNFLPL